MAHSILQDASCAGRKSEKLKFAQEDEQTIGQKLYSLTREALQQLVEFVQGFLRQGHSVEQVLEVIMPL